MNVRTIGRYGVRLAFVAAALLAASCGGSAMPAGSPAATPTSTTTSATATSMPLGGIVFSIAGAIWRVNSDGSGLHRIIGDSTRSLSAPDFSPSGDRIAYVEDHHYVVIAGDLGADHAVEVARFDLLDRDPVTPTGADNLDVGPVAVHWSPDGAMLLVTRQRTGGSGISDVLIVNVDGSGQRTVLDRTVTPSFIEATWAEDRSPGGGPLRIVIVAGSDGKSGVAYDLDGHETGPALPLHVAQFALASHQDPAADGVLVTSTLGSPEPSGAIDVIDVTGASRTVAQGCHAAWSPGGDWIIYYDDMGVGQGVAVVPIDGGAPPRYIVTNDKLPLGPNAEFLCNGFAATWRQLPFSDAAGG